MDPPRPQTKAPRRLAINRSTRFTPSRPVGADGIRPFLSFPQKRGSPRLYAAGLAVAQASSLVKFVISESVQAVKTNFVFSHFVYSVRFSVPHGFCAPRIREAEPTTRSERIRGPKPLSHPVRCPLAESYWSGAGKLSPCRVLPSHLFTVIAVIASSMDLSHSFRESRRTHDKRRA